MSREERLARLGLLHLIDKPEELEKALAAGVKEHEDQAQAWIEEAEQLGRQGDARIRASLHALSLEQLEQRCNDLRQTVADAVRERRAAYDEAHELELVNAERERRRVDIAPSLSPLAHKSLAELEARFHELDQTLSVLALDSSELPAAEVAEYVQLRAEIAGRSRRT